MKKMIKYLLLTLVLLGSLSALATTLVHEKTTRFKKDPAGYLSDYAKRHPISEGSVYLATNLSADAWVTSIAIFSGKDLLDVIDATGGEMVIYRLDNMTSSKRILLSGVVSLVSPFSDREKVDLEAYVQHPNGDVVKLKTLEDRFNGPVYVKTLALEDESK